MKYSRITADEDYKCQPVFWHPLLYVLYFVPNLVNIWDEIKKSLLRMTTNLLHL